MEQDFIMTNRWKTGNSGSSIGSIIVECLPRCIVADLDSIRFYGGILVRESVPLAVREHIIHLHNESLERNHEQL